MERFFVKCACGQVFRGKDTDIGKRIRCPKCKQPVAIKKPEEGSEEQKLSQTWRQDDSVKDTQEASKDRPAEPVESINETDNWYYSEKSWFKGRELGPFSKSTLKQMLTAGSLASSTLVRRGGDENAEWILISEVLEVDSPVDLKAKPKWPIAAAALAILFVAAISFWQLMRDQGIHRNDQPLASTNDAQNALSGHTTNLADASDALTTSNEELHDASTGEPSSGTETNAEEVTEHVTSPSETAKLPDSVNTDSAPGDPESSDSVATPPGSMKEEDEAVLSVDQKKWFGTLKQIVAFPPNDVHILLETFDQKIVEAVGPPSLLARLKDFRTSFESGEGTAVSLTEGPISTSHVQRLSTAQDTRLVSVETLDSLWDESVKATVNSENNSSPYTEEDHALSLLRSINSPVTLSATVNSIEPEESAFGVRWNEIDFEFTAESSEAMTSLSLFNEVRLEVELKMPSGDRQDYLLAARLLPAPVDPSLASLEKPADVSEMTDVSETTPTIAPEGSEEGQVIRLKLSCEKPDWIQPLNGVDESARLVVESIDESPVETIVTPSNELSTSDQQLIRVTFQDTGGLALDLKLGNVGRDEAYAVIGSWRYQLPNVQGKLVEKKFGKRLLQYQFEKMRKSQAGPRNQLAELTREINKLVAWGNNDRYKFAHEVEELNNRLAALRTMQTQTANVIASQEAALATFLLASQKIDQVERDAVLVIRVAP